MFDRYYSIKSFCHLKTLEKRFDKLFLYYYKGAQKHEGFVGFEKACSRAKTYVMLISRATRCCKREVKNPMKFNDLYSFFSKLTGLKPK